jgi:hypothetical protein
MFNTPPANAWIPYTIPACPSVNAGDNYALSAKVGANPSKNPSQFLEWKKVLPKGKELGDTLYWDPAKGEGGEWVVLPSPSGDDLRVLTIQNRNLAWTLTQDC